MIARLANTKVIKRGSVQAIDHVLFSGIEVHVRMLIVEVAAIDFDIVYAEKYTINIRRKAQITLINSAD